MLKRTQGVLNKVQIFMALLQNSAFRRIHAVDLVG